MTLFDMPTRYTVYDFVVMFHSNYASLSCLFWDTQCRKISRPWNTGQGSIKVIESGTFDRLGMVSY